MITKYTTVRLEKETVKMLQEVGKKKETYDEIIKRLMKNANNVEIQALSDRGARAKVTMDSQ